MKDVAVSTKDLKIWYIIEELSADQIADKLTETEGFNITGDSVVELIRERGIQKRNIRRTEGSTYQFTNPEDSNITGYVNMNSKVQLTEAD